MKRITIRGAREHNPQNVNLELPRDKFIVITGLSGSEKSTLAFDTLYVEQKTTRKNPWSTAIAVSFAQILKLKVLI